MAFRLLHKVGNIPLLLDTLSIWPLEKKSLSDPKIVSLVRNAAQQCLNYRTEGRFSNSNEMAIGCLGGL